MAANIPTITRELAFAAGHTAADIRTHRAGRTSWNRDEAELAVRTTNKLLMHVPFEKGGLLGLDLTDAQLADLGIAA